MTYGANFNAGEGKLKYGNMSNFSNPSSKQMMARVPSSPSPSPKHPFSLHSVIFAMLVFYYQLLGSILYVNSTTFTDSRT